MKQYAIVIAAAVSASFANLGAASATVFDITGNSSFSGKLTIDTVAGNLTLADVLVGTPPDFQNILSTTQGATEFSVSLSNTTGTTGAILFLSFADGGTLTGFTGGTIDTATLNVDCTLSSGLCLDRPDDLGTATLSPETAATPLPAALPLFATGIGTLGLLGWRRKRKARAVA